MGANERPNAVAKMKGKGDASADGYANFNTNKQQTMLCILGLDSNAVGGSHTATGQANVVGSECRHYSVLYKP